MAMNDKDGLTLPRINKGKIPLREPIRRSLPNMTRIGGSQTHPSDLFMDRFLWTVDVNGPYCWNFKHWKYRQPLDPAAVLEGGG